MGITHVFSTKKFEQCGAYQLQFTRRVSGFLSGTGSKAPTADHSYGTAARIVIAEQCFSHPLPVAQRLQSSYGTLLSSQYSITTLNLTWFHFYPTSMIKAVRTSRTDRDLRQQFT